MMSIMPPVPSDEEEKYVTSYTKGFDFDNTNAGVLDLSQLPLEIDVAEIDQYPNETYALMRKNGLGTSDSSALLNVNPYTTRSELIAEKCRNYLTQEELEVGDKAAVRKGRDLEPLIISKSEQMFGTRVIKPIDMYRHKEYPWIKFNFDGVMDKTYYENDKYQYIPNEIKVVTLYGQKHYNFKKAWMQEGIGWTPLPDDHSKANNSIETKAAQYGIPGYYYTQLQQQIMGLNAPFGYLTTMLDSSWQVNTFFIWRDNAVINALVTEGYKVWAEITNRRGPNWSIPVLTEQTSTST